MLPSTMQNFGLSDLLSPMSLENFLNSHWPKEPLFIEAQTGKLQALLSSTNLTNLESLAEARTMKVRACLPDFDDEYSSIHLDPKDALKAYRNQMTLVFDSMHLQDKTIHMVLHNIRRDLGLVTGGEENNLCKARSIVYATPKGSGTRLHFDANVNFILQISGSKRWILAPNTSVVNPTERFTMGAPEMPKALEKQFHDVLPSEIPDDAIEVLMEPGTVLFVPRGYWHMTLAEEDSLSLNFTFSQPTFADVFTKSMQELLLTSSDWRELADGLESKEASRRETAVARLQVLMSNLAEGFSDISAEQLLKDSELLK
jgi:50S ribosomal protein L16 3-hydroxylase